MISFNRTPQTCPAPGVLAWIAIVILAAALAGCGGNGLPDSIRDEAKSVQSALDSTQDHIQDQKKKFTAMTASKRFRPMAAYADQERWAQAFERAESDLNRAGELKKQALDPLIKTDNPETLMQVSKQIRRIRATLLSARKQAGFPFERMDRIQAAMSDPKALSDNALAAGRQIRSRIETLADGPVARARKEFPQTRAQIEARFAPFLKLDQETQARMTVVRAAAKTGPDKTDFAAFATAADTLTDDLAGLEKKATGLETQLGLLYQSYTKVLQDMKTDYFVTIKRESWDDNADYYDPRVTSVTRQVSPAVYQALDRLEMDSIADITPVFGRPRFTSRIGDTFRQLKIDPFHNWPFRTHNAATFWIQSLTPAYFHKYLKEENGETEETDWIKVNPSVYEQNLDNLGMAVLSKPYGEFEPDAHAAPPGLAYVGNPRYGEWKKDDNGENFWSWYGRYAFFSTLFFFPPSYFYYGSWNRWHTGYRYQKPYYGQTSTGQTLYGTRGTKIKRSPRYQSSTFARTGGFKTAAASVRGGGPGLRGGGPKGKGK